MHLVLCQSESVWESKLSTRVHIHRLLASRPIPAGSLIILPEMCLTGFSMQAAATAEPAGGPTEIWLHSLAREFDACVLAGLVTDWQGAPRNQALAVAPDGSVLARYTKQRPFTLADESAHYPGGDGPSVFEWGGFRIAPLICYDLRFPELFRAGTAAGATLFAVLANWPSPRHHHWRSLLIARAIENQAIVAGVNRAGRDPEHTYSGGSLIIDALGHVITEADDQPGVTDTSLDPHEVATWRAQFPAWREAGPPPPPRAALATE